MAIKNVLENIKQGASNFSYGLYGVRIVPKGGKKNGKQSKRYG